MKFCSFIYKLTIIFLGENIKKQRKNYCYICRLYYTPWCNETVSDIKPLNLFISTVHGWAFSMIQTNEFNGWNILLGKSSEALQYYLIPPNVSPSTPLQLGSVWIFSNKHLYFIVVFCSNVLLCTYSSLLNVYLCGEMI